MITTRRALLFGAGATVAAAATSTLMVAQSRTSPVPDLAGLVPDDADLLLLIHDATDDRAIRQRLGGRSGRTVFRAVAPLARGGFADLDALIGRASAVHVVAIGGVAESLVIEMLLRRTGAVSLRRMGDMLVAKLPR